MYKIFLIVPLFIFQTSFSQQQISEEEKTENLIQVWGLLKYHHPEVTRGRFNFDKEFLEQFRKMEAISIREDNNKSLLEWIEKLGSAKLKPDPNLHEKTELFKENADFSWVQNSGFSSELQMLLGKIRNNTNYKNHYASINKLNSSVEFTNEKGLDDFDVENKAHRLLFLASFWNAMKYWNVNLYLADTSWQEVLQGMIPAFAKDDPEAFEPAKEKLFTKLNDSHSNYEVNASLKTFTKFPGFAGRIINDSLVVTKIFDKALAAKDAIELGDVIYSIENTKLKQYYYSKFGEMVSASNENYLKSYTEKFFLLASSKDSIKVGIFKKNGTTEEKFIHLAPYNRPLFKPADNRKRITSEIGYLNLSHITNKELKIAFEEFDNTKGIIIDLRNYPRYISPNILPKYLYPDKKTFVKILTSSKASYGNYNTKPFLGFIINPLSAGRKNRSYYKGKVILLVDRSTASKAEFMGMAIQAAPNTITIGEQTFGAVMNKNEVPLMDNTTIDFTGAGAFYPDDQHVQRKGLRIDYPIKESAKDYNEDLYLEEAIRMIAE